MDDEAVTYALAEFARWQSLPPLVWVVTRVRGRVEVEGFGEMGTVSRWAEALGFTRPGKGRDRDWHGALGEWQVDLLAA